MQRDIYKQVLDFFDGNEIKAKQWFKTSNPMLGGISPEEMIVSGRIKRLQMFVENSLECNRIQEMQTYDTSNND